MRIPIFGHALQHSGNVRVVRTRTGADAERIRQVMEERDPAVIQVGEPIPTDGCGDDDREALREQTHEAVAKLRSLARQRLRALGYDPGGID